MTNYIETKIKFDKMQDNGEVGRTVLEEYYNNIIENK